MVCARCPASNSALRAVVSFSIWAKLLSRAFSVSSQQLANSGFSFGLRGLNVARRQHFSVDRDIVVLDSMRCHMRTSPREHPRKEHLKKDGADDLQYVGMSATQQISLSVSFLFPVLLFTCSRVIFGPLSQVCECASYLTITNAVGRRGRAVPPARHDVNVASVPNRLFTK